MSLFDQIGKRISDVGQGVVKQSKNLTDTARLNSAISEKKKEMSRVMWEMGQDYYLKHKKDVDCEEQEYIDQINAMFREVIRLQKELEHLKETNTCSSCGAAISDGALFCTNCGTLVGQTSNDRDDDFEDDDVRRCPFCGEVIDEDSYFCCYCGADLSDL